MKNKKESQFEKKKKHFKAQLRRKGQTNRNLQSRKENEEEEEI